MDRTKNSQKLRIQRRELNKREFLIHRLSFGDHSSGSIVRARMATSFSSATLVRSTVYPQQNPYKTLVSFRESFHGVSNCVKYSREFSSSSASSYVTMKLAAPCRFSSRLIVPRRSLRRAGIVRAATIEEIEAEKASIEKDVTTRMERTIETVRSNFNSIRTGRANPAMLDKIEVEYYGTPVSLKSIAQISTPDASSLLVQPYDKSSLKAIEKAIVTSDVGMTPNNDGEVIRLSIPTLTSERRKELSKIVAKQAEEGKVALRNIRRDALKAYEKLEKEKKLSEDIVKDLTNDLQKLTDEYIKKIESVYKQKEKELLTV